MISRFLLLTYTLGPAAAIPSAIGWMNPATIFLALFVAYTLPIPFIFFILDRVDYESKSKEKVLRKTLGKQMKKVEDNKSMHKIYQVFVNRWGYKGFYMGLTTLTFAFGFIWPALIAYILKLPRVRSYVAIGFGNLIGILFWLFVTIQSKGFIKPESIIIIVLLIAFVLFLYGEVRERKILESTKEKQKDILSKFED